MNRDAKQLWDVMLELGRRRSLRDPLASVVEGAQLTSPQVHCIAWLGIDGPLPVSVLATRIGTSAPGATGLIDRLERAQLVMRRPSATDRRVVLVQLSPAGEALAAQIISAFQEKLDVVVGSLAVGDRRSLLRIMTHIATAMGEPAEEDGR